jgi:hypothetical protein
MSRWPFEAGAGVPRKAKKLRRELGAARDAEAAVERAHVPMHRAGREAEFVGDLLLALALQQSVECLAQSRREPGGRGTGLGNANRFGDTLGKALGRARGGWLLGTSRFGAA